MHSKIPLLRGIIGAIFPGIYLVVVLIADYYWPGGLLTPFFVTVGLLLMAIFFKPRHMIPWAIIYATVVVTILLNPTIYRLLAHRPYLNQSVSPYLRATANIIVAFLSCYLCVALDWMGRTKEDLVALLSRMPSPIVVSDANGHILYFNDKVGELLPSFVHHSEKNRTARNYFDFFSPAKNQGRTISRYLNQIENSSHHEFLELYCDGRSLHGKTQVMNWSGQKVLLTIIEETKSVGQESS